MDKKILSMEKKINEASSSCEKQKRGYESRIRNHEIQFRRLEEWIREKIDNKDEVIQHTRKRTHTYTPPPPSLI